MTAFSFELTRQICRDLVGSINKHRDVVFTFEDFEILAIDKEGWKEINELVNNAPIACSLVVVDNPTFQGHGGYIQLYLTCLE